MKTIVKVLLFILYILYATHAGAQQVNGYMKYRYVDVDSALGIPADTVNLSPAAKLKPHLAVSKDSTFMIWSVALQKYIIPRSASSVSVYWSDLLGPISGNAQLVDSLASKQQVLPYSGGATDYIGGDHLVHSLDSILASMDFVRSTDTVFQNIQSGTADSLHFENGLYRTGNYVYVHYEWPIWDANKIQGKFVEAIQPHNKAVMQWDSLTNVIRWTPMDSLAATATPTPSLQQVTDVGAYTSNGISAPAFSSDPMTPYFQLVAGGSNGRLLLTNPSGFTQTFQTQSSQVGGNFYFPNTPNGTDTLATLYDVRAATGSASRFGVSGEDATATQARTFDLNGHDLYIRDLTAGSSGNGIRFRELNTTNQNTVGIIPSQFYLDLYDYPNFDYETYFEVTGGSAGHFSMFMAKPGGGNNFWLDKDSVYFSPRAGTLNFKLKSLASATNANILYYDDVLGTITYGAAPAGGGGTSGIDDVLAVGQSFSAARTINTNNQNFLISTDGTSGSPYNNKYIKLIAGLTQGGFDIYTRAGLIGGGTHNAAISMRSDSSTVVGANKNWLQLQANGLMQDGTESGISMTMDVYDGFNFAQGGAPTKARVKMTIPLLLNPMVNTNASAIYSPTNGMMIYVSSTDATFTSTGFWIYENGAWAKMGTGSGSSSSGYQTLAIYATNTATTGTTQQDLYTYTLPANTLTTDGDAVQIEFEFQCLGGASANSVYIQTPGTNQTVFTSSSSQSSVARVTFTRTGSSTSRLYSTTNNSFSAAGEQYAEVTSGINYAGTLTFKIQAITPSAAGNIVLRMVRIAKLPHP